MIRPETDPVAACGRDRPRRLDPRRLRAVRARGFGGGRPHGLRRLRRLRSLRQRATATTSSTPRGFRRASRTRRRSRPSRSPGPSPRRSIMSGVLAVEMFLRDRGRRRAPGGQRDRAAGAQFRPLDPRRRRDLAVRAACARRLRLAARRRPARLGRVEMQNLIGDDADAWERILAEPGRASAPLRQGRGAAGPQDGARDAGFSGERAEPFRSGAVVPSDRRFC